MNEKTIANEIFNQLGGNKFLVMTGSKNFTYSTDENNNTYLSFHLTRNKSGAKYLKITYISGDDLYDMEFTRIDKKDNLITVAKESHVYDTMLRTIFTQITGLRTSL